MPAKIIIGADFVPSKSNQNYFVSESMNSVIDEPLIKYILSADYRIFNLEVPLTDSVSPIKKCGPNLIAPASAVKGYKALKVDFLTLANNHIMDQGEQGLQSTINLLKEQNISYCGAGSNLKAAAKPYIVEISGIRIGLYCCAEHEFSIAEDNKAGANPFDALDSFDHVKDLKQSCDYVICLFHGGKEYYRYPSPLLQKICRKFIDCGVNLLVCQHSHCVGCQEIYRGGTIVYGQGNFLFDNSNNECWKTGILVELNFDGGFLPQISYTPIIKNGYGVKLACREPAEEIMSNFFLRSEKIKDNDFVKNEYNSLCLSLQESVLNRFDLLSSSLPVRIINKITRGRLRKAYFNSILLKRRSYTMLNTVECEAWREALINILKVYNTGG